MITSSPIFSVGPVLRCRFRAIRSFLFLLLGVLLLSGCGQQQMEPPAPTATYAPLTARRFALGVQSDGTPFWKWEGVLKHEMSFKGLIHWGGCHHTALFQETDGRELVEFEINVAVTPGDRYKVSGTYDAQVPITLTLLGTSPEPENDRVLVLESGVGEISYEGSAPFTYEKKQEEDAPPAED